MAAQLPDGLKLGLAALRVSDPEHALDFYVNKLGFVLRARSDSTAMLGTVADDVLRLEFQPGLKPRNSHETGLYHVAILVPDRASLGAAITRLAASNIRMGAADHLVSEAIYVWDPDNNGIEIYCDRPRETWTWVRDHVLMENRPLDFESLRAETDVQAAAQQPLKNGTRIGHVHLQVDDLAKAGHFYSDIVGFALAASLPGARFLSAGRYHHHLGTNVWESRKGPLPSPDTAGLSLMTLELPDSASRDALQSRLQKAGIALAPDPEGFSFADPWQTNIAVRVHS